jgi:hypothetical protein
MSELTFTVSSEAEARELRAAWREIESGKRLRLYPAAEGLNEIMERARSGLKKISEAIESNPGTGQTAKLARFMAGLSNGHEYQFDLTELRTLDADLAGACIDYLNYDRLGKADVHQHLAGGAKQLDDWVRTHGPLPPLHLSQKDLHASRLSSMAQRLAREADDLLREALNQLLIRYEARTFGCLLVADIHTEDQRSLMHAFLLSEPRARPLCGATEGSWATRPFDFDRLTCNACKDAFFAVT